jgi:multisubunit Na+/H+ antiporter MnhF subunit
MHTVTFQIVIVWQLGLLFALGWFALRTPSILARTLALDSTAIILVASISAAATWRAEPSLLDLALIVAMVGFAQTVATARLLENNRALR